MKKLFLRLWPIGFIFFIWLLFSYPFFLKGLVPFPSRYQVTFFSPWSAYPQFAGPVKNNAMPDVINQIYPWKYFTIQTYKQGQIPLWNPYSFAGTPHLANYQSAVLSPFNLLFFILPFVNAWSLLILLQPLLAGICMYLFIRSIKVSQVGSLIGSIAFMFCGFMTTWMAYGTLGYAILFLPLALFAIEKYFETHSVWFVILLSITVPLSLFSGHSQISVYFLILTFAYILFKYITTKQLGSSLKTLTFFLFGLLLTFPQLLPTLEFYSQSLRSTLFEKLEVIPWSYLPTFLAPDYLGNPVTRNDWFGHYAEWNAYVGVLPIFLSFVAVTQKKNRYMLFFLIVALAAILLSFPTPFLDLMVLLRIPLLSTSAASRIIVLFSFSTAVLSGLGYDQYLELIRKKRRSLILPITFFILCFVILWAIILLHLVFPIDKLVIAKQNMLLPTFFFLIAVASIVSAFTFKPRRVELLTALVFITLISVDMLRFSNKWMPFDPKSLVFPTVSATQDVKAIAGYERALGNYGAEVATYYGLPSLEGYDALYIRRYGEFIATLQNGNFIESPRSLVAFPKQGIYTFPAIDLLNVRYIVHKIADGRPSWGFPFWTYPDGQLTTVAHDATYEVFKNTKAFPHTFLVSNFTIITDPQKTFDTLFSKDFDRRNSIILAKNPGFTLSTGLVGSAKITIYTPDLVKVATTSNKESLLFLSDTYYPGWLATIDGENTPILRADYTFRAVVVPEGQHTIVFRYQPMSFMIGIYGAVIGIIGILGGSLFLFTIKRKTK